MIDNLINELDEFLDKGNHYETEDTERTNALFLESFEDKIQSTLKWHLKSIFENLDIQKIKTHFDIESDDAQGVHCTRHF